MLALRRLLQRQVFQTTHVTVRWIKQNRDSNLAQWLHTTPLMVSLSPFANRIERLAADTDKLGAQEAWQQYKFVRGEKYDTQAQRIVRRPNQIRINSPIGNFIAELVGLSEPDIVVEIGTGFGVSGMYWLAGLESSCKGELLTFEPHKAWANIARCNLSKISNRFTLTEGVFEENIDRVLEKRKIDLAFIDAIHTSDFVVPQFEIISRRLAKRGVVMFDDIQFSSDMALCWETLANDSRVLASATLSKRAGIIQLR